MEVNNGRQAAFLNFIESNFFRMHPLLKSNIFLFYSNGLAIEHGLPDNGHVKVNNGRLAAILNLLKLNIFQNASSSETIQFVL